MTESFSPADLEQMAGLGVPAAEVDRQLRLFASPPPKPRLVRPCRPDDGIARLAPQQHDALLAAWSEAARRGRLLKFVPASGAASRMFSRLEAYLATAANGESEQPEVTVADNADEDLRRFFDHLPSLALASDLRRSLQETGDELEALLERQDHPKLVRHLLEPSGLGLLDRPKALIDFHLYPAGPRSAFEEHLIEGRGYLADPDGRCRFHFTVSAAHRPAFDAALERIRSRSSTQSVHEVSFSVQSPATDTLAVDEANRPFRTDDGRLLFRPSGHGALIQNLDALQGDIVFIKNIDNVSPERNHPTAVLWKRLLAGYLAQLQRQTFELLERLEAGRSDPDLLQEALRFIDTRLTVRQPETLASADAATRRRYIEDRLDRPLRVCGMVRNVGEPGGGPFWIRDNEGSLSGQIVERAQVDHASPEQQAIWQTATHFSPTDLVCGLRNRRGEPFDLQQFIDPAAVFITEKTHGGRRLKALERPGLWNGAMARWNTAFVEVPLETFTPVKTVFDLLRPEHRV